MKAPLYFIIPGGGWHVETRQSMIDFSKDSVEALRNEGFAVVSIDYRVCGEGVEMKEIITDCFDAARYVAHFSDVLEIDKDSFVLSGHSAGAHLALMLSYAPKENYTDNYEFDDEFTVLAVAAMSPPTILSDNNTHNLRDLDDVFSEPSNAEKDKHSPITYVNEACPPTLLCAGTSDYLVFANSSEKLYNKLKECNVPCELILSVGGGHSFERMHETIEPSLSMTNVHKSIVEFVSEVICK